MSWNDTLSYLAFGNPVSKTTIAGVSELAKFVVRIFISSFSVSQVIDWVIKFQGIRPKSTTSTQTVSRALSTGGHQMIQPLWKQIGHNSIFIRLAALSGASAVCFAAYGRHKLKDTPESKEFRNIYESANNMHMIHSVVLLAVPLVKRPAIVSLSTLADYLIQYLHFPFWCVCNY